MIDRQDERRQSVRRVLRHQARIIGSGGSVSIPCTIVDVSETGAGMEVAAEHNVPESFILRLSEMGMPRRICRLVWRTERRAGVRFELGPDALRALAGQQAAKKAVLTDVEAVTLSEG